MYIHRNVYSDYFNIFIRRKRFADILIMLILLDLNLLHAEFFVDFNFKANTVS